MSSSRTAQFHPQVGPGRSVKPGDINLRERQRPIPPERAPARPPGVRPARTRLGSSPAAPAVITPVTEVTRVPRAVELMIFSKIVGALVLLYAQRSSHDHETRSLLTKPKVISRQKPRITSSRPYGPAPQGRFPGLTCPRLAVPGPGLSMRARPCSAHKLRIHPISDVSGHCCGILTDSWRVDTEWPSYLSSRNPRPTTAYSSRAPKGALRARGALMYKR